MWIIGIVSDEELAKLRKIGWEDVDPPAEMISVDELLYAGHQTRAFFVDSDVFTVMTGSDWEPLVSESDDDDDEDADSEDSPFGMGPEMRTIVGND
jgi:hypothetical protein